MSNESNTVELTESTMRSLWGLGLRSVADSPEPETEVVDLFSPRGKREPEGDTEPVTRETLEESYNSLFGVPISER